MMENGRQELGAVCRSNGSLFSWWYICKTQISSCLELLFCSDGVTRVTIFSDSLRNDMMNRLELLRNDVMNRLESETIWWIDSSR